MKRLTSSVYTFDSLITGEYLYVDKTEYIWNLIEQPKGIYFMSRPRRFGKSLTISTLEAVFRGRKELFRGLAIYDKPYDWKPYPVIHLDMNNGEYSTPELTLHSLANMVARAAKELGVSIGTDTPGQMFLDLITALGEHDQVVILVDEYDKPLLNNIGKPHAQEILAILKTFYSKIKAADRMERFVFITGVSKFSHVSIFSDLNNLFDVTMDPDYATMMGYTQREFEANFAEHIDAAVATLKLPREEFLAEMKKWYDGYRFEQGAETVYTPVSVANFFISDFRFKNYWFSTGTPTFLLDYCRENLFDFEKILTEPVSEIAFEAYEVDRINPLALLLQTGYLTIKDSFVQNFRTYYYLKFPNGEVQWAFEMYLLTAYTGQTSEDLTSIVFSLIRNLGSGNVDEVMKRMQSFFAAIPYDIQVRNEKYYQTIFFSLFYLLGIDIEAESRTSDGRIDATASVGDWRFLFEFKLDGSPEIALDQIMAKEYFRKFLGSGKRLMVVGANFDFETRRLADWKSMEITRQDRER